MADPNTGGIAIPPGLPETPCVLRAWAFASALSARYYGAPVYLVGGALTDPDPRDLDIVVPLDDELFVACYGDEGDVATGWANAVRGANPPPMWRRWARDCAKTSRQMTLFCRRAVDFKVQPECYFAIHEGLPRVRLDCGIGTDRR